MLSRMVGVGTGDSFEAGWVLVAKILGSENSLLEPGGARVVGDLEGG